MHRVLAHSRVTLKSRMMMMTRVKSSESRSQTLSIATHWRKLAVRMERERKRRLTRRRQRIKAWKAMRSAVLARRKTERDFSAFKINIYVGRLRFFCPNFYQILGVLGF